MVATPLTPINTSAFGATLSAATAVDATNNNSFINPRGNAIIEIVNGGGSTITVTFTTTKTVSVKGTASYNVADNAQTIANGASKVFGPFDADMYNDANGVVTVAFSSGSSVTARVLQPGLA